MHYPLIRRTVNVAWDDDARAQAEDTERQARAVITLPAAPARLQRSHCKGCSYLDYCWGET